MTAAAPSGMVRWMDGPLSPRRRAARIAVAAGAALVVVVAVVVTRDGDDEPERAAPSGSTVDLPHLQDVPLMVYGDSWSTIGSWHSRGHHWSDLLAARPGVGPLVNKGIGGSTIEDTANLIGGDTDAAWPHPATPTCVIVMTSLNAAIRPDTALANRERSLESVRAAATTVAAVALADEFSEDRDDLITYEGGDWVAYPGLALEGGSLLRSSSGAITFTVPEGYERRQLWMATIIGAETTTYSLERNGIRLGERTTPISEVQSPVFSKFLLPVGKVDAGDVITVRHVAGTFWFDGIYVDSGKHHVVFATEPDELPNSGYANAAQNRAHNQVLREVVAEVNRLVPHGASLIDLEAAFGWDPTTMTGPDRIHPNDAGQEWILSVILDDLRGVPDTRRLQPS